jgi:uncharacterized membrane protein YbaN (DUF454 family)
VLPLFSGTPVSILAPLFFTMRRQPRLSDNLGEHPVTNQTRKNRIGKKQAIQGKENMNVSRMNHHNSPQRDRRYCIHDIRMQYYN